MGPLIAFALLLFLAPISFSSDVNATSFSVIDSFFQTNGTIQIYKFPLNYNSPDLTYFNTSHKPLYDKISSEDPNGFITFAKSEADFDHVYSTFTSSTGFYNTSAYSFSSAEIFFKPNFSGIGDLITFDLTQSTWSGPAEARIVDLFFGQEIFYAAARYPTNDVKKVVSYSLWNPDHVYSLKMRAEGGPATPGDSGGSFVYHNMQFASVPEPGTMLLLAVGLIGLAGYGRRKFKG